MDIQSIEHRNLVLKSYFKGRDWDLNSEYLLKRKLVLNSNRLLPQYPYVIEDEWEVTTDKTNEGKGDLVFTNAAGYFAVVEVKYINLKLSGGTTSQKRTFKRKTVREQAIRYADDYANIASSRQIFLKQVAAFTFTNESNDPKLLKTINVSGVVLI